MMFYSDPVREQEPHALPDAEVFYINHVESTQSEEMSEPGYYYWFCQPGCMPDSDPYGPFTSEQEAIDDCRQNFAE